MYCVLRTICRCSNRVSHVTCCGQRQALGLRCLVSALPCPRSPEGIVLLASWSSEYATESVALAPTTSLACPKTITSVNPTAPDLMSIELNFDHFAWPILVYGAGLSWLAPIPTTI